MEYKTVCYVWIRNKVYTSVFSNDEFAFLKDRAGTASYYAAKYSEIDKIIVREELV